MLMYTNLYDDMDLDRRYREREMSEGVKEPHGLCRHQGWCPQQSWKALSYFRRLYKFQSNVFINDPLYVKRYWTAWTVQNSNRTQPMFNLYKSCVQSVPGTWKTDKTYVRALQNNDREHELFGDHRFHTNLEKCLELGVGTIWRNDNNWQVFFLTVFSQRFMRGKYVQKLMLRWVKWTGAGSHLLYVVTSKHVAK